MSIARASLIDVVVTVPKPRWLNWLAEGDLPGDPPEESTDWGFFLGGGMPAAALPVGTEIRCYVVAHGHLRGYAPIVRVHREGKGGAFVRRGGAVACTLFDGDEPRAIAGFQGWRSRTWAREDERPFPAWATHGLSEKLAKEVADLLEARKRGPEIRAKLRAWALGEL